MTYLFNPWWQNRFDAVCEMDVVRRERSIQVARLSRSSVIQREGSTRDVSVTYFAIPPRLETRNFHHPLVAPECRLPQVSVLRLRRLCLRFTGGCTLSNPSLTGSIISTPQLVFSHTESSRSLFQATFIFVITHSIHLMTLRTKLFS